MAVTNAPRDIPPWQRWNDYGIGMLLKGKAELRQASEAFSAVEKLNRFDGPLNLARVTTARDGWMKLWAPCGARRPAKTPPLHPGLWRG